MISKKTQQIDGLVKSSPAKAGLGAQKLRSEVYTQVRRNDEVAAQRGRWTFYQAIQAIGIDITKPLEIRLEIGKKEHKYKEVCA